MSELADKTCVPCRGGVPPLTAGEIRPLHVHVPDWKVVNTHHLSREFRFVDFVTALKFVDRIGAMAEEQSHHPDIHLAWGKVRVEVWTHKIDGLTESDFIFDRSCGRMMVEIQQAAKARTATHDSGPSEQPCPSLPRTRASSTTR